MKKTTIILKRDGSIKATGHGYSGPQCLKSVDMLDKLFGLVDREKKASFYEAEEEQTLLDTDGYPSGWCG